MSTRLWYIWWILFKQLSMLNRLDMLWSYLQVNTLSILVSLKPKIAIQRCPTGTYQNGNKCGKNFELFVLRVNLC